MKVRVYELARELGLTSRETMELCAAVGIGVASASSGLDEERAELVRHQVLGHHPSATALLRGHHPSAIPRLRAIPGGLAGGGPASGVRQGRRATLTLLGPEVAAPPRLVRHGRRGCVLCGATPAAATTFRQCTGKGRRVSVDEVGGPFCRDCGTVVFRDATDETWTTGWWGVPAFFVNWVVLARNLLARTAVVALPPPRRADRLTVDPMPLGRPLLRRRSALVAALMLAVLVATLAVVARTLLAVV